MDWDHLRVFLAIARENQILAAARKLGLNYATVSRRLDALEESLGAPLFDRSPGGSRLTQAGERLLPMVERVETELLGITDAARATGAAISGTVRVGAPDGLGNLVLAAELGGFALAHPGLQIELAPLPRVFSLSRREVDLAIVLDPPTEGRLVVSRLGDYTLGVYGAETYVEKFGVPATLQALAEHAVVCGVEDYAYSSALDYSRELERNAGHIFRCAGMIGQLEAVKAGVGIGVLHDFAAAPHAGLIRLLPEITFRRSYYLISHPETRSLARIAAVQAFLVDLMRARRRFFVHEAG